MQTIALENLTPVNVNLDSSYAPSRGAGGNGWVPVSEAFVWSLALTWSAGNPGPGGQFVVQGTDDAVCKPLDLAVNPVADANLVIYTMLDDQGAQMVFSPAGIAGQTLFRRERASGTRWVRLNYTGGAVGCTAQITKLMFHAVGLRDA